MAFTPRRIGRQHCTATTLYTPATHSDVFVYLDPASRAAKACAAVGRHLTQNEWTTYLRSLGPYRATCSEYPAGT